MRPHARTTLALALVLAAPTRALAAQTPDAEHVKSQTRSFRVAHEVDVIRELASLLAIPNLATDSLNIRRNARHLVRMLSGRGMRARLLEVPGVPPAVYGELATPGASRTVVFYAHYDGQPVNPADWSTAPWRPTLRDRAIGDGGKIIPIPRAGTRADGEWRLYARSASDDKAPIVALVTALDALRAARIPLSVNLKVFLDGEEERGSPNLARILDRYGDLLGADLWVFGDGPVHQSGRQQVVFGVRGAMGLEMTVYGPNRVLHSGHYGNWAPNPAALLANVLASMRDADGRVRIAGFYDDVRALSPVERAALDAMPPVDSALRRSLGLGWTEGGGERLAHRVMLPALNVRGLRAGGVGEAAANAIPTEARASIDFRLVPDLTPERVRSLVEQHLRKEGYFVVHDEPDAATRAAHPKVVHLDWRTDPGYPGLRTPMDLPASRALLQVVSEAVGGSAIAVPSLGGSLPLHEFDARLEAPLVILPIVNSDNNQHAANENVRLQNLWDGIEVYAAVLARLGSVWETRSVP